MSHLKVVVLKKRYFRPRSMLALIARRTPAITCREYAVAVVVIDVVAQIVDVVLDFAIRHRRRQSRSSHRHRRSRDNR